VAHADARGVWSGGAGVSDEAPILLIDLAHIVHALWHLSSAEPDLDWTSTQALAKVRALTEGHAHVAICTEGGRPFRKDLDAAYKANRPEKNAPLLHQLTRTEEALRAEGFPVWRAETFEADDVIATATLKAVEAGRTVLIASSDKDLLQLVSPAVNVLSIRTGELLGEPEVREKFGVTPTQMRDYLTLVGDASDNIAGAPGIGAKKAKDLLTQYGTLDALMSQISDLTPATAKTLTEHSLQIQRARALVTLRTDAPIPFADIFEARTPLDTKDTQMEDAIAQLDPEIEPVDPPKPGTALVVADPQPLTGVSFERALEPRTAKDTLIIAERLFKSNLLSGYGNPNAVALVIFAGRELGLGMMASLRGFHNIQGKVTMAADLMRGLVISSGKAEYFQCKERTADTCTWVTKRKGDPDPTSLTFTYQEADDAGLVKPNSGWTKHRADMVAKTASAKLCRLVYADLLFGMYGAEEMGGEA
jgi:5'-3' exonuclease